MPRKLDKRHKPIRHSGPENGLPSRFKKNDPRICKTPQGRTSTFTEELGERIVNFVWSGECRSLVDVERQDWAPTRRTIHTWKRKYPEFGMALEEAQRGLGDVYVDDSEKIKEDMLAGTVEPAAANVAIRHNQWMAQNVDPYTFGNKSYIKTENTVNITNQHINRIDISGLDDEQLDALEGALNAQLLIEHNGDVTTAGED